jgi:uncharacterized protein (TIGR00730 family)
MKPKTPSKPFRSAKTEVKNLIRSKAAENVKYPALPPLAFTDPEFILRKELRPMRLMLEFMKPEITQRDENIESTIVIFGSARIQDPKIAKTRLSEAQKALKANPGDSVLAKELQIAESIAAKSVYYTEARNLAYIISSACQKEKKRHFVIVTGGGPGIMEAANRGAYEAKAKSIGLNIVLPIEQQPNPYISPELCFQFHYFAMRKMHFLIRSRALIVFPGGYGTLDELFETLTLLQTRKIKHRMPVLLFGKDYWSRIINFQAMVDEGMIPPEDLQLFQFVETAEEAWKIIAHFYQLHK